MRIPEEQAVEIASSFIAELTGESHEYKSSRFVDAKQFDDGMKLDASWVVTFKTSPKNIHKHGDGPINVPSLDRRVRVHDDSGHAEIIREL